jgi:predicted Zn-dependent protease
MAPSKTKITVLALVAVTVLLAACATVPITGRKQLSMISDAEMTAMSFQQYEQVISESNLSTDAAATAQVKRVGARIQGAVEKYFADNGMSQHLEGYAWEFNLIEDDQPNAWCMPGGKVAFYTGIMPICRDDTGVAVVMGHEIAHAIAEHGGERMSHQLALQMGGLALSEATRSQPEETQAIYMSVFAVGAQYGAMLPYSRTHESEADHMGLIFMAMAGYDPQEAPRFWERMSAGGGAAMPEFMSTHPSDETRIRQLNERMPEALGHYRP